jgi:hypothetical protein
LDDEPPPVTIDDDLLDNLAEQGIELGIDPATVPAELQPAFRELVNAAVQIADEITESSLEAEDLRLQREELSRQFTEEPDKILLTFAATNAEMFGQVVEHFQRMESDPDYKQRILEKLDAEARLAEASRREKLVNKREEQRIGKQLTHLTRTSARRFGVDTKLAEQYVGMAITAKGGQPLSRPEIDEVVRNLARRTASRQPVRRALTAEQAAAARTAPTAPVGDSPPAPPPESAGSRKGRPRSKIRELVANAAARVTQRDQ